MLLEKLDSFAAAPFTIQRISELLSDPRKNYSRIDKFMRAVEKTILVVSTVPPGRHRSESENGDSLDSAMNGDFSAEVNVDVDMEQDGFGKEVNDVKLKTENQVAPSSTQETVTITKNVSPSKPVEVGASNEDEKALPEIKVEATPTVLTSTADATSPVKSETPTEAPKKIETPAASSLEGDVKPVTTPTTPEISSEAVVVESKIDEALLNEPIRPADNEILVDTSEISSETTPLAALENIVAIRTEAPVIEQVEPPTNPTVLVNLEPEAKVNKEEPAPFEPEDEPEVEAKKMKLSEVPENSTTEAPVTESVVEPEKLEKSIDEVEAETPAEPVVIAPAVEEKIPEAVVSPEKIADASAAPVEAIVVEKIDEPAPEIAEIPIETASPAAAEIVETASTEMETVPTIAENKMSLDEDEAAIELEMTPIANKMDTDESAPMDFEDDAEPMDQ